MTNRTFYRTVYEVEVLSEEPIPPEMELDGILREGESGNFSYTYSLKEQQEIDGQTAAKLLIAQQSDASFFYLTNEGEDNEDWDGEGLV